MLLPTKPNNEASNKQSDKSSTLATSKLQTRHLVSLPRPVTNDSKRTVKTTVTSEKQIQRLRTIKSTLKNDKHYTRLFLKQFSECESLPDDDLPQGEAESLIGLSSSLNYYSREDCPSTVSSLASTACLNSKKSKLSEMGGTSSPDSLLPPFSVEIKSSNSAVSTSLGYSPRNYADKVFGFQQFVPNSSASQKVVLIKLKLEETKEVKSQQLSTRFRLRDPMQRIGSFVILKKLGNGRTGEVLLARHVTAGFDVALKAFSKTELSTTSLGDYFINEVKVHSRLLHERIVKLYGVFEEGPKVYMVMESMHNGTLIDKINEKIKQSMSPRLSFEQTRGFIRSIVSAVNYLHKEHSIMHRDIKPENIVISSMGVAKLCDFGCAITTKKPCFASCGTREYLAPQIIEQKEYGPQVDIWCIGVLTYQLLLGKVPFAQSPEDVTSKRVNFDFKKSELDRLPELTKSFIFSLLQKNPLDRPSSEELLKHRFLSSKKQ